jgi:hypothetical protein
LPIIGFALYFVFAIIQERGGWNPGPAEFVVVALACLGTVLLPVSVWHLMPGKRRRIGLGFVAALLVGAILYTAILIRTAAAKHEAAARVALQREAVEDAIRQRTMAAQANHAGFGPVIERVLNAYGTGLGNQGLDFENGALVSVPEIVPQNEEPLMTWVKDHGVDLLAVNKGGSKWKIFGPDLKVARLPQEQWDRTTPEELRHALEAVVMATEEGWPYHAIDARLEAPLTFALEAGHETFGLLQITSFTNNPRGLQIRYKLVQTRDPIVASHAPPVPAWRVLTRAPFSLKLPEAELELWAVSRFEPRNTNRVWWRPDGSALEERIRGISGSANLPNRDLFELAFRVGEQTNGAPEVILESVPGAGAMPAGLSGNLGAQRMVETVFRQTLSCELGLARASFRVGVAAGIWKTLRHLDFASSNSSGSEGAILCTVIKGERETSLVCSYQEAKGWQTRLIAVGSSGEIEPVRVDSLMAVGNSFQYSATFATPAIQGAQLQLQRRPYRRVEFRNVSLVPGQRTKVELREGMTD